MATFVAGPVRVTVPATSANLGPGFDSLGLALSLRDELEAEVSDGGLRVEVTGAGADDVPRDESHLVVRSMRAAFDAMDAEPPGLALRCDNVIPHGRGLGSSSAAIVAGVALARALVAGGQLLLDDDALFQLAADIEGHPDNVAPAFYGGFVISGREDERLVRRPRRCRPSGQRRRLRAAHRRRDHGRPRAAARTVPHADAAANSGRAALLVAALAGQPEHLLPATRDYLHQEQREPAMPESLALVRTLRADGIAAVISRRRSDGARVHGTVDTADLRGRCPDGWACHDLAIEPPARRRC